MEAPSALPLELRRGFALIVDGKEILCKRGALDWWPKVSRKKTEYSIGLPLNHGDGEKRNELHRPLPRVLPLSRKHIDARGDYEDGAHLRVPETYLIA